MITNGGVILVSSVLLCLLLQVSMSMASVPEIKTNFEMNGSTACVSKDRSINLAFAVDEGQGASAYYNTNFTASENVWYLYSLSESLACYQYVKNKVPTACYCVPYKRSINPILWKAVSSTPSASGPSGEKCFNGTFSNPLLQRSLQNLVAMFCFHSSSSSTPIGWMVYPCEQSGSYTYEPLQFKQSCKNCLPSSYFTPPSDCSAHDLAV